MNAPVNVTFRHAEKSDLPTLLEFLRQLNAVEGNPRIVDGEALCRDLFSVGAAVTMRVLLAIVAARPVGAVFYYPGYDTSTTSTGYHLADIVVHVTKRGQGIGRLLVARLAEENLAAGGEWISLTVLKKNASAQQFYKALGMTEVPVSFFAAGKETLCTLIPLLQK